MKVKLLSHVQLLATPWTAAYQAPPSMGFARQEYWGGVPLPSPSQSIAPFKFTLFHLQRARSGPRLPSSDIKCPAKCLKCLIPFKQNIHYYHYYMDKINELREVKEFARDHTASTQTLKWWDWWLKATPEP